MLPRIGKANEVLLWDSTAGFYGDSFLESRKLINSSICQPVTEQFPFLIDNEAGL